MKGSKWTPILGDPKMQTQIQTQIRVRIFRQFQFTSCYLWPPDEKPHSPIYFPPLVFEIFPTRIPRYLFPVAPPLLCSHQSSSISLPQTLPHPHPSPLNLPRPPILLIPIYTTLSTPPLTMITFPRWLMIVDITFVTLSWYQLVPYLMCSPNPTLSEV